MGYFKKGAWIPGPKPVERDPYSVRLDAQNTGALPDYGELKNGVCTPGKVLQFNGESWEEADPPKAVDDIDNDLRRMMSVIVDSIETLANTTKKYMVDTRHMVYLTFVLVVILYGLHLTNFPA